jgi:hypothetical protein
MILHEIKTTVEDKNSTNPKILDTTIGIKDVYRYISRCN